MTISIRPADFNDIDTLVELEARAFTTDRISRRSFRTLLERTTAATLAAIEGEALAGYAMVLYRGSSAVARLYSLAVDPKATGKGIGARLLKAAEETAFRHGSIALRLEVREDNKRAIQLYEKSGYRQIGRHLDYYADHMPALRFEKRLRGDHPLTTTVPYYRQAEDFTCGPACLMMAMAHFDKAFRPDPVMEIRLWREATTVFMMSGPGGCEPHGLAVAAHEHGMAASVIVSVPGPLFLDSVRSAEKRRVMQAAQADFRAREERYGISVAYRAPTLDDLRGAIADGKLAIVLVSGYHFFGKKVPHWVLAIGDDGGHLMIHDPWVETEAGETVADTANIPIPYSHFMRMAQFGKDGLRAAVILGKKR
jgi:ribosomal protein S18 acetylase RimI-like enzyme